MTNEEWVELHLAIKRTSLTDEATGEDPPQDHANRIEWERLSKLSYRCRYCDREHPEYYMLQRPGLWNAVAPTLVKLSDGTEHRQRSGYVCVACLAERTPGHGLYREDFNPTSEENDDLGPPAGALYFAEGKSVSYWLHFPSRAETDGQAVNVEVKFYGNGEWTNADWDTGYAALVDTTAWLEDYCCHLGWRLVIDGMEQDLGDTAEAGDL